jgi:ABC-2 type transport system ATP-binding protein
MKMQNAIELQGLKKRLGNFVLGPIDLIVPRGCIVGYIGENGAGKSTTIKLLLNLMIPDQGEIKLLGKNIREFTPQMKKDIAYVFDDLYLPEDMTLKNVQNFHRKFYGQAWQDKTFSELIARFNLPDNKTIKHFSRGMRMQLGLALALSHRAKLLLLDEATSGLDPVIRDDILDLLLEYIQNEDHTVLVSSHILSDLEKVADYIAFIHKGQLLFIEAKDELVDQYGITSLSKEQLAEIDDKAIVGQRPHQFGVEVMLKRNLVPDDLELEKVSIEDIMVYMIKGERK